MANLLQAINAYGPKIELEPTAQLDELVAWMARSTGVNKSEVMMILQELHEAIITFAGRGTPIKLPGVGTFTPTVDRNGMFKINLRADVQLKKGMNNANIYVGRMKHRENIGVTNEALKELWDAEHPGDPLIL